MDKNYSQKRKPTIITSLRAKYHFASSRPQKMGRRGGQGKRGYQFI
jgi:hypothetical protein